MSVGISLDEGGDMGPESKACAGVFVDFTSDCCGEGYSQIFTDKEK